MKKIEPERRLFLLRFQELFSCPCLMLVSVAPTTGSWPHEAKLREEIAAEGEKTELNSALVILLSSFFMCAALLLRLRRA